MSDEPTAIQLTAELDLHTFQPREGADVTHVVSSPLERAQETAAPAAAMLGLEVATDDRLIEAANVFEGKTFGVGDGSLRKPQHWVHLRTSNPIESTFATVRHRTKLTKGPGSRAAGLAMAFKLIEAAQDRWRAVNAPHLVALVRAGARFECGRLVERPTAELVTTEIAAA